MPARRFATFAFAFLLTVSLLSSPAVLAQQPAAQGQSAPLSYHIVLFSLGPSWDPALPPQQQPGIHEHIGYMQKLMKDRVMVMGGPFVEGPKVVSAFYILDAKTPAEARQLAEADPAVVKGLMKIDEVRTFLLFATSWKPADKPAEK